MRKQHMYMHMMSRRNDQYYYNYNYYCAIFGVCIIMCLGLGGWCHGQGDSEAGSGSGAAPMEKAEQAALYSAIQGFVGNWWNGSDLYPDPCGWTPIQGVSCDIIGGLWYVTALSIGPVHDNSLACATTTSVEFRPQLFHLKYLKSLSFFNCFMSPQNPVTLPQDNRWEALAGSLELLEFRSNPGLMGHVPTSFGYLTSLHSLVLLENGLTGTIPANIGNLTKLNRLVLSGNRLTGQIPHSVGRLRELLILDLSRNSLSGHLPSAPLGALTGLLKLDLSGNQLEGKLLLLLGAHLKNLTLLDVRNNRLSGGLRHSNITEMPCLEELVLSNNPLGGSVGSLDWQRLQNLVILDLSNVGLTGEIPDTLSGLKRLRFVGLANNNLTGDIPPKLAISLPSLTALYLNGNNLTGVLQFPPDFYGKMGRRFGAWNNPNLCYHPLGLGGAVTATNAPYGVKPCQGDVTTNLVEPINWNSGTELGDGDGDLNPNYNSHFTTASLGFSSHSISISNHGPCRFLLVVDTLITLVLVLALNLLGYS